jgi:hypothetical protein
MSTLAVNTITNAGGGNTAQINGMTPTADSLQGFRNRIINGDMRIAQRGTGAFTGSGDFPVDRFVVVNSTDGAFSAQQDSSAPPGFVNSVKITTTTADATLATTQALLFRQPIEGTNVADFGWGTANAQTVTLSFWVRSSLTGTFGGSLRNSANNRSYAFAYSISLADTWEYKTVTIPGDTTGTWLTTTGEGVMVTFGLGVGPDRSGTAGAWAGANYHAPTGAVSVIGTLNATFYITGVQLEAGSVATPFERRPYGTELALCQRYYCRLQGASGSIRLGSAYNATAANGTAFISFPMTMRISPTALEQSGTAADYGVQVLGSTGTCTDVPAFQGGSSLNATTITYTQGSLVAGQGSVLGTKNADGFLGFSAEL